MFEELLRVAGALPAHEYHVLRPDLIQIRKDYDAAVEADIDTVQALIEERAGLRPPVSAHNAPYRLRSIRLQTVLPAQRRAALEKKLVQYNDEIGDLLPQLITASIGRALAADELARERLRDERVAGVHILRQQLGIHDEVVEALDSLYNVYGVSRWHWAAASGDQLRAVAATLKRVAIEDLELRESPNTAGPSND